MSSKRVGRRSGFVGCCQRRRGLGLENQGGIDLQSIAGATATCDVLTVSVGSDDYLAAWVSLGALGVVSQVTLQTVPLYTLIRRDERRALTKTLERLDEFVDDNDHFEFVVFPYGETALTRTTRRTHEELTPTPELRRKLYENSETLAVTLFCRTGRRFPAATSGLNRLMMRMLTGGTVQGRTYTVCATERNVRSPRWNTRSLASTPAAHPACHRRGAPSQLADHVAARGALFRPDDALLSTAHGCDTCYIAVHQYSGMEFETYFRAVEAIMDDYAGRPHWGKRHYQTARTLRERYPEWDRFGAVRDRVDPDRVFLNDYTRRVLGN